MYHNLCRSAMHRIVVSPVHIRWVAVDNVTRKAVSCFWLEGSVQMWTLSYNCLTWSLCLKWWANRCSANGWKDCRVWCGKLVISSVMFSRYKLRALRIEPFASQCHYQQPELGIELAKAEERDELATAWSVVIAINSGSLCLENTYDLWTSMSICTRNSST